MENFVYVLRLLAADGHIRKSHEIEVPVDDSAAARMVAINNGWLDENDEDYTLTRKNEDPTGRRR